ncbi:hypothetical protein PM082_020750 [Marasmius tenuissimus]|nr:hypothetical protein PM082_020750 [Marasmius tenuissimus]
MIPKLLHATIQIPRYCNDNSKFARTRVQQAGTPNVRATKPKSQLPKPSGAIF